MPRSGGGTYTLPEAAFVAGTVIQSSKVNSDLSDMATALTQSLATTGVSTMTGPIKAATGSLSAPSITFGSATGTGFYLSNTNEFTWVAAGVAQGVFGATGALALVTSLTAPAITATSTLTVNGRSVTAFDTGTAAMFVQTAAPTGWTKSATHNDKTLRVVSGTASSGGSVDFSTLFARTAVDAFTLTSVEIPTHVHSYNVPFTGVTAGAGSAATWWIATLTGTTTGSAGSSGSHVHNVDMRVKYVDVIIATKDA